MITIKSRICTGIALLNTAIAACTTAQEPPPIPGKPGVEPVPPPPPPLAAPALGEFHQVANQFRQQQNALHQQAEAMQAQAYALGEVSRNVMRSSGGKGSRVLVIPSESADAKRIAALEEDLAVMGRILEKTIGEKESHASALGIDVLTFAGPGAARHLYVDGHGAIFTLNVRIPLAPPPIKKAAKEDEEPTNSVWEEAHEEVFGRSDFEKRIFKSYKSSGKGSKEEYDAKRVDRLKESLIEALKHAGNIRNLKADDRVTIVVSSGAGGGIAKFAIAAAEFGAGVGRGGGGGGFGGGPDRIKVERSDESSTGPSGVLTLHARKSDIDSFAKGKLDLEAFQKKVTMLSY